MTPDAPDATPDADPAVPTGAVQLTDVLRGAASEGFAIEFEVAKDGLGRDALSCEHCGRVSPAAEFRRTWSHRLEGVSDPADMLAVSALTCPACGVGGVFVSPYGPAASGPQATVLRELPEPERETPLPPD